MKRTILFSPKLLLLILTIFGAFLHFYNLNWGAPFYFHPDERNIASAVSQFSFPHQLNPHFFAYGSLPIYTIFFSGLLLNFFSTFFQGNHTQTTISFDQAIIISRGYSALFATLLIPLMYSLGSHLKNKTAGVFAAALTAFSTGIIQFAHFGTFELWLTILSVCLLRYSLNLLQYGKKYDLLVCSLIFGLLIATKVSAVVLFILPLFAYLLFLSKKHFGQQEKVKALGFIVGKFFLSLVFFTVCSAFLYCLTNPYVFLDQQSFLASMHYESSVGLGTLPVFYTSGFFDTIPVLYQLLHVYPFLLNPLLTALFIISFFFVTWRTYKTRNLNYLLLLCCFLILFLSQAVLFIKWTRNMLPTLPFIFLLIAITIASINHAKKVVAISLRNLISLVVITICIVFSLSYFVTAFVYEDTRFAAVAYAKKLMPRDATILSEPYDIGLTPFNAVFPYISFFNFYEYDNNAPDATKELLTDYLERGDYIILPSQRILQIRMQNPQRFPKAQEFYTNLLSGNLGYQLIYQTPCDLFCRITYLGDPVYYYEQTANVFDRPTVFIFQKKAMQARK